MNKIFGGILVIISIVIFANLIPSTITLLTEFGEAMSKSSNGLWGAFMFNLLVQAVGWIIAYFLFRYGRKVFKAT